MVFFSYLERDMLERFPFNMDNSQRTTLSRLDICCCVNSPNVINIVLCLREFYVNIAGYTRDNLIN